MAVTKVEWAKETWNPITGCNIDCPYCYARLKTKRFSGDIRFNLLGKDYKASGNLYTLESVCANSRGYIVNYPFGFNPTFHKYKLNKTSKFAKPSNIAVCLMGDAFGDWVPFSWEIDIFDVCKRFPENKYLFLTKNPKRYRELAIAGLLPSDSNYWYGTTITNSSDKQYLNGTYNTFLAIEPILERIDIAEICLNNKPKWVIIGAETGNRKGRVIPDQEWIIEIVNYCKENNIPLFMESSLKGIMQNDFVQEFPEGLKNIDGPTEKQKKRLYAKCGVCKAEKPKKDMFAILYREKRGQGDKSLAYICKECFEDWKKQFD